MKPTPPLTLSVGRLIQLALDLKDRDGLTIAELDQVLTEALQAIRASR